MTKQCAYAGVPEPRLAHVLDLWRAGHDTLTIARMCSVPEATIYNMLARLSK
jgi:hypothetical protein